MLNRRSARESDPADLDRLAQDAREAAVEQLAEQHDVPAIRLIEERHRRDDERLADTRLADRETMAAGELPVGVRIRVIGEAEHRANSVVTNVERRDCPELKLHQPPIVGIEARGTVPRVLREGHERIASEVRASCSRRAPSVGFIVGSAEGVEVERAIARRMAVHRSVDRLDEARKRTNVDGVRAVGSSRGTERRAH